MAIRQKYGNQAKIWQSGNPFFPYKLLTEVLMIPLISMNFFGNEGIHNNDAESRTHPALIDGGGQKSILLRIFCSSSAGGVGLEGIVVDISFNYNTWSVL